MTRYVFTIEDFHLVLFAGLPAHDPSPAEKSVGILSTAEKPSRVTAVVGISEYTYVLRRVHDMAIKTSSPTSGNALPASKRKPCAAKRGTARGRRAIPVMAIKEFL